MASPAKAQALKESDAIVTVTADSDANRALAQLGKARYATDPANTGNASLYGSSDSLRVLTTRAEVRAAVNAAAAGAQRLISIYSPDLEPELYDQTGFLDIIKHFVLARSFSKVRVLLQTPARVMRDSNRFVAMGRRLSSCIDIRHVAADTRDQTSAYLIADDRAVVFRMRADAWDGIADLNNPKVAKLYLTEFDSVWNASAPERPQRVARRG
jgi:hypothetical protein